MLFHQSCSVLWGPCRFDVQIHVGIRHYRNYFTKFLQIYDSAESVWKSEMCMRNGFHPYKLSVIQKLIPADPVARINTRRWTTELWIKRFL